MSIHSCNELCNQSIELHQAQRMLCGAEMDEAKNAERIRTWCEKIIDALNQQEKE